MLGQSHMKTLAVCLAVLVCLPGCKRRTPAPVAVPAPAPTPPTNAPASIPPPPQPGTAKIITGDQNLPKLNAALQAYLAKYKKAPARLDELAKEGLIPFIPMAPPGQRYELDAARGEVKLVNPMVK
ncbi:MAG: hypothetical protein EBS05_01520 [Proteobacteria bacterium]|jgi:hypothetical protein|nr:hypothetical protein [Pseudomonadota bacterium]